jgi:hypothetical protein
MAYTLSTATTEVRALLNETTASFWSDTEIQNWIKEGVMDISTKALLVEDQQNITLVTDQLTYTSSDHAWIADVLKIIGAYYNDGAGTYKGLIKIHPRLLGNTDLGEDAAGRPRYYCFHDKTFWLDPVASATENNNVITVLHSKKTNDITLLEFEYQHLAIKYAAAMAKVKDRKYHEAQLLLTQYTTGLNFERSDKYEREVDSLDMFMIPKSQRIIPQEQ